MAKRYEELTISDDFIFGKTMGDKVLCHDVLERMLEKRVGTLEDIQPQREFQYAVDGKPVRLDMYARDRKSYRELPEEIQKVAQLDDPEVLLAMQRKYGMINL